MKIEKRKIRGETSEGMLCSSKELGLGQDHEGIMALTLVAEPGTPFLDAMPIGDTRLVIDVLPNRPDLLSHEGLAREIAAATGGTVNSGDRGGKSVRHPKNTVKGTSGKSGLTVRSRIRRLHAYAGESLRGSGRPNPAGSSSASALDRARQTRRANHYMPSDRHRAPLIGKIAHDRRCKEKSGKS